MIGHENPSDESAANPDILAPPIVGAPVPEAIGRTPNAMDKNSIFHRWKWPVATSATLCTAVLAVAVSNNQPPDTTSPITTKPATTKPVAATPNTSSLETSVASEPIDSQLVSQATANQPTANQTIANQSLLSADVETTPAAVEIIQPPPVLVSLQSGVNEKPNAGQLPSAVIEPPAAIEIAASELAMPETIESAEEQQPSAKEIVTAKPFGLLRTLDELKIADLQKPVCKDGKCGEMQALGTQLQWASSPAEAYRMAAEQDKMVFLIHVSGNFEIPGFT